MSEPKKVDSIAENLREERRAAKAAADLFVSACQTGDVPAFLEAVDQINETVGGWLPAMRKVAREVHAVSPEIRSTFLNVWIKSKMLPLRVGNHWTLCDAARVLLPSYNGPSVRLFRGTSAGERRRRIYGVSWSADIEIGERFAQERRVWNGGSVLLETVASPKAIICQIDYPPPITRDEIEEKFGRDFPHVTVEEYHDEREYVVDRRYLNKVGVVRRYEQVNPLAMPPPVASNSS